MQLLLLDNYDSFTWNLQHYLVDLGATVDVRRNDALSAEEAGNWDGIVLSPGPGLPAEAGVMNDIIRQWAGERPILGICLGMQAIAEVYGGSLRNLGNPLHGVEATCTVVADEAMFRGLGPSFPTGHYHSWVVDQLPEELEVTARAADGWAMALRHRSLDVRGVQFHPESVLTPDGRRMLQQWLSDRR